MGIISLEGLEFFAYNGVSAEEQKIGNRYSIDINIVTDISQAAESDKLKETVDYGDLYDLIRDVMLNKHKLLEHIGNSIILKIRDKYPDIDQIEVSVSKFNPPIGGVCDRARVVIAG